MYINVHELACFVERELLKGEHFDGGTCTYVHNITLLIIQNKLLTTLAYVLTPQHKR